MSGLRGCPRSMTMPPGGGYRETAGVANISTDFIARMHLAHAGLARYCLAVLDHARPDEGVVLGTLVH